MEKTIQSKAKLNNDVEIPFLGLGVFRACAGRETYDAVSHALGIGYRHVDTAWMYGNEKDVGDAIKASGVPREDVFVTTKLWNTDQGYDKAIKAFDKSLNNLGLDYLDLYLLHWPVEGLRKESWEALITLQNEGKCRAIGVCNFTIEHLKDLLKDTNVTPAVNQVEFSPFLYQKELHKFCRKNDIQLEAYSPLTRGKKLNDKNLVTIAEKYQKSPAQILIRWTLQHDIVVIPKSVHKERIEENAQVFDFHISDEDMEFLDSLNEDFRVSWNPSNIP